MGFADFLCLCRRPDRNFSRLPADAVVFRDGATLGSGTGKCPVKHLRRSTRGSPREAGCSSEILAQKADCAWPALVLALESEFALGRPQGSDEAGVELQPTFAFLQSLGRTT